MPGEGNEQQALYWQVSDDWGLTWSAPRAPLQPVNSSSGRHLPMWSPVTHTRVRGVMRESRSSYDRFQVAWTCRVADPLEHCMSCCTWQWTAKPSGQPPLGRWRLMSCRQCGVTI